MRNRHHPDATFIHAINDTIGIATQQTKPKAVVENSGLAWMDSNANSKADSNPFAVR
jgi:hypothetical protein